MGGGIYSASVTRDYVARTTRSGRTMAHATAVSRGEVANRVHPNLDPKRPNSLGQIIRESRDSVEHPNSVPIAVFMDTTGSMRDLPLEFIKFLPELMNTITERGYLADPQVLFGAVNDATTFCIAALEVGQFESGNQMDGVLSNILVSQGGGGGTTQESYELAMYFMARKTELDCLIKRDKKGYMFIIGDETPYDSVSIEAVQRYIGDTLQEDIPTTTILEELKRKFEVFWLYPAGADNSGKQHIQSKLTNLFGQRLIQMRRPQDICTSIAAAIAVNEGRDPREVAQQLSAALTNVPAADIQAIVDAIPPRRIDDI